MTDDLNLKGLAERLHNQQVDLWNSVVVPAADMFARRDEIAIAHSGKPADELTPAEHKQAIINEVLRGRV